MRAIRPDNKVSTIQRQGCTEVNSYSRHWPCLFPQHGPGKKHTRLIELAQWQREIVERYPGDFARGLFHSDGYRGASSTEVAAPCSMFLTETPVLPTGSKDTGGAGM
jgi:hypothetical protein